MATCPNCGANSRTDETFTVDLVLKAKPIGTFSLAGAQMKTVAQARYRLRHGGCGWSILGTILNGEFLGEPTDDGDPAGLPWARFDAPEPIRPRREPDWCNPGEVVDPGRSCHAHAGHHYCVTCVGWYGVPHDLIHTGKAAHPEGNRGGPCACRPCRVYASMTGEEIEAAYIAYDTRSTQKEGQ